MRFLVKALLFMAILYSARSEVKEYFITCDPVEFQNIYDNYSQDIYIDATVTYQTQTWDGCSLRIRGDGSRAKPKKSLKIVFDKDRFVGNVEKINLNAEWDDPTYFHQYLSARLFRESGQPCFNAEHVRVYLNGEYFGLYLEIENMDEDFLMKRGLDPKANMYKATVDNASLTIFDDVDALWEKKSNETADWNDLRALIDSLENVPDERYYEFARRTFDYDAMVNIISMNILIGNKSTYYHNYYMFHDINRTGKWTMFPWDLDKTFLHFGYDYSYSTSSKYWSHDNPFVERALMCDPIFEDIKLRTKELAETLFNKDYLYPIIDSLESVLKTSVEEDQTDNLENLNQWIANLWGNKNDYIEKRYDNLEQQFKKCPRVFRVKRTPYVYGKSVRFEWESTVCPSGDNVKYKLGLSNQSNYDAGTFKWYDDIEDTALTVTDLPEPGRYWWVLIAYNGSWETEATDNLQEIVIANYTDLECTINSDKTLTKENSPYYVDCDVNVNANATLTIQEGVDLIIAANKTINIYGGLKVNGSAANPVRFYPETGVDYWGGLNIENPAKESSISHAEFLNACINLQFPEGRPGSFAADNIKMEITSEEMENFMIFESQYCNLDLTNSTFFGIGTGQGVHSYFGRGVVDNCFIDNFPDAIEFIGDENGTISNCRITNSGDDAIDCNGVKNLTIRNNYLSDCADKGISLGWDRVAPSENIQVFRNLIVNCGTAISVKSGSEAWFANNTFHGNATGVHCYVKDGSGQSGPIAHTSNCIFSACSKNVINKDEASEIFISYSLSDTDAMPGENNIKADPGYKDIPIRDFSLKPDSPCINTGDPASETDPDGTRNDIGAFPFDSRSLLKIVINEINYNSPDSLNPEDWVELYNAENKPVDISGWYFSDGDNTHKFVIENGTVLQPDSYIVLVKDIAAFTGVFPDVNNYIGEMDFGLSGSGELVRLFNSGGALIDSLTYMDELPWPEEADGNGPTLELRHPELDNSKASSWRASKNNGTPGYKNSVHDSLASLYSNPVLDLSEVQIFPNPAKDYFAVEFYNSRTGSVQIGIFDMLGSNVFTINTAILNSGRQTYRVNFPGIPAGVYQVVINNGKDILKAKLIIGAK